MNEIIGQLTSKLGIKEDQAAGGLGVILGAIKDKAGEGDFASLTAAIPEASGWIEKAKSLAGSGGGGGLLGKAAGMLGGGGGIAGILGSLGGLKMDVGTAKDFIPAAVAMIKEKAGDALFAKLGKSVPFLGEALGKEAGGITSALGGMAAKH